MPDLHDTILAQSSPLGPAARAIVRLSGPRAVDLALSAFHPDAPLPSAATFVAAPGRIRLDGPWGRIDVPATLLVMRSPHSYTRDDVAELHLPGSPVLVDELLAALTRSGARPATPGEFTARAFLSGRLDLSQAEGVMAVIAARGRRSLAAAQRLVDGALGRDVAAIADTLADLLARVELAIDFSDQPIPIIAAAETVSAARTLRDRVVAVARRSRDMAHIDGDLRLALVGRPNVGKSSLFNRLAGADRALVTDVAGTTRDELRETFTLAGSRFVLSDTAGLDEAVADIHSPAPSDRIGRAARERTLAALARAELVLVVVEAGRMIADPAARDDVASLLSTLAAPAILVINKCDVPPPDVPAEQVAEAARRAVADLAGRAPVVATSARTGAGLDALRDAIVTTLRLGDVDRDAEPAGVSARQRECLESAAESLARAALLADAPDADESLLAMELRDALDSLGEITGSTSPQAVLDRIFSRFCLGK